MHNMNIYSSLSGCLPEIYYKLLGSGVTDILLLLLPSLPTLSLTPSASHPERERKLKKKKKKKENLQC